VRQGGHDIPVHVIRRRFTTGRVNFKRLYQQAVDDWMLYDNAGDEPLLLDWKEQG
jgi:predicted ABC-type ATPase